MKQIFMKVSLFSDSVSPEKEVVFPTHTFRGQWMLYRRDGQTTAFTAARRAVTST